jgi:putative transposase
VLERTFDASAPNRKWIADFTYVWTAEGWLYVASVIDLFSRRVVGWSMSAAMTAQLVTDALVMAIWRRGKSDALLHHSDRGSQYTSEQFQKLMADHGVVCSMSRSGNVSDNAAMESFFSSLKTERVGRKTYRTRDEARADVFDYISPTIVWMVPLRDAKENLLTHRDAHLHLANVIHRSHIPYLRTTQSYHPSC